MENSMSDSVPSENGGDLGNAPKTITLTQPELDAMMAKNRRSVQQQLTEAQNKAQAFDALHGKVSELLDSGLIDGVEDLDGFRTAAEEVISRHRSESETLKRNQSAMESKLTKAMKDAEDSRSRYATAMVQRQIADDAAELAVDGPGREGAIEFFQLKLGQLAQFNHETGEVGVKWKVTDDETGRTEEKVVPIKQALKDMEANPSKYGRYFRSTVNGGAGGETVDGVQRTPDGGLDFAKMDFNKFKELSKKNPRLLREQAEKLTF
jgi:hypothetical protein